MKTTGQSEKLRGATTQEEQNSDSGEEQAVSLPDEEKEQETTEDREDTQDVGETPAPASETTEAEATGISEETATPRKKRKKKAEEVDVEKVSPRPSYWPIALAFSLCVMFLGLAYHPVILGIGAILVIASVIAWGLERR
jgi:hypothetical protein